jgi:hypothetical protein
LECFEGTDRADGKADGGDRGRDGGIEGPRPDGLGRSNEQHQAPGGGSGDSGPDPQLTIKTSLKAESVQLPAFLVEERIFGILQKANYKRGHNKDEIRAYFTAHISDNDRATFIKAAFEQMVYNGVIVDGVMCGYQAQPEGVLMWEGNYLTRISESRFSWSAIEGLIEQLIVRGEFSENLNTSFFPSITEQQSLIEQAEAEKASAFSISQADIDGELLRGSGFQDGKYRIYRFYQNQPSTQDASAFLKKEYGVGGHSHTFLDGQSGFVDHDGKGIAFKKHGSDTATILPWTKVHRRISELITLNRYLSEKEKTHPRFFF